MTSTPAHLWPSILELGVADIDEQHRALFELLHRLTAAAAEPGGTERLQELLEEVDEHTRAHFEFEERLMRDIGFPDADAHIAEHARLLQELADYRARLGRAAAADLSRFVQTWFIHHLIAQDRRYADFLQSDDEGRRP